jgi:hypothetical protein
MSFSQPLCNSSLDVMLLPSNSAGSTITDVTKVTALIAQTANIGSSQIYLQVVGGSYFVPAGIALSFAGTSVSGVASRRRQVVISQDVVLTTSPLLVPVEPLQYPVLQTDSAVVVPGLLPINGITTLDISAQETSVDTTNASSRKGVNSVFIRRAISCNVSGIALAGDKALETVIKPAGIFSNSLYGRDIYAVITLPNGERIVGVAKVGGISFPANQNEVMKYSFNLTFQGDLLEWTSAFSF